MGLKNLISLLWVSLALVEAQLPRLVGHETPLAESYDFVVIGGGTSGLTVADRLTENPNVTVLVIERGPLDKHEPSVMVPGLLDLETTPYQYNLTSIPQSGLKNGTFQVPAAKVVGGGTVINGMFFDRGAAVDYDAWEDIGNPGWNWKDMLPYFKTSETFTPATKEFSERWHVSSDEDFHGFAGPVRSSYPVYQYPSVMNFLRGWKEMGVKTPKDPGAGTKWGAFWAPGSLDPTDETRSSSRTAHYDRVSYRSNYHLMTETTVSRVLFEDKYAIGVELCRGPSSRRSTVKASKEVILAAGIHSAQVLQISGIGPKQLLRKHGIETIIDLPGVGQNLQDHPTLYPVFEFNTPIHPNADDLGSNKNYSAEQLSLYWTKRQGAYTITHLGGNVVTFLPLPNITDSYASIINLASNTTPSSLTQNAPASYIEGYRAQVSLISDMFASTETSVQETGFSSGSVMPITLVKPLSRGTVLIKSSSILDAPEVDFGTFSHPADLEIMVEALRVNRKLMQTPAMQELQPLELVPGANVTTDAEIKAALRGSVSPTYSHPCCTCPMMPENIGGVVDSELKVHGVEGLRVVDASIMPMIPATHLSYTVYAVAERAAEIIKGKYMI